MTLLPESLEDRAHLLDLFVSDLQAINKKGGHVMGTYQILERLESIANHMQIKDLVRAIEGDLIDLTSHHLSELDEGNLERVKEMFFEIAVRLD